MKKFILALIIILVMLVPAYAKSASKVDQLAHAIAKAEGFYTKGTVPNRFNNPGDITSSSRHAYPGQVGLSPHHHYVIFKNASYGWAALRGQIQRIIDGKSKVYKQNMTFAQITHIYVGAAGPWEKNWERNICSALGVTPRTTFQEFFELAPKVKYEINYGVLRTLASAQSGDRNAPRGPAQQLLAPTGYSLRPDGKGLEIADVEHRTGNAPSQTQCSECRIRKRIEESRPGTPQPQEVRGTRTGDSRDGTRARRCDSARDQLSLHGTTTATTGILKGGIMPLCSVCSAKLEPTSAIEAAADKVLAGTDLELYDFGGGYNVAPLPDQSARGEKYLAQRIAALVERRLTPDAKVLPFYVYGNWRTGEPADLEADIKRALEAFPTKAIPQGSFLTLDHIV